MKTPLDWDYTDLAADYDHRPDYSPQAIDRLVESTLRPGGRACDIGAGTGRLSVHLAERGFRVVAVEPNPAMMGFGLRRTRGLAGVDWVRGLGEATGLRGGEFDLAVFGSSWNVLDRRLALSETSRLLKPEGWLACLYNHRDLADPLQERIEAWIHEQIPDYRYGQRRRDLAPEIAAGGLFQQVQRLETRFVVRLSREDWLRAWSSHATLRRQAGDRFPSTLDGIRRILRETPGPIVEVPYTTRLWLARKSATVPAPGRGDPDGWDEADGSSDRSGR